MSYLPLPQAILLTAVLQRRNPHCLEPPTRNSGKRLMAFSELEHCVLSKTLSCQAKARQAGCGVLEGL